MPTIKEKKSSKLSEKQKRRESCILLVILIFTLIFAYLLVINPVFAGLFGGLGVFLALFLVYMVLSSEPLQKDVERLKLDTNRRAITSGYGGGGLLFLEDGRPTKRKKHDED